ncbi:MAG: STAS/SEC14 domain-containing protein [Polyangiaceae bacterium]|nr:STAS/SEC14 domain-containing protein [Polyangiaceae bacterium]
MSERDEGFVDLGRHAIRIDGDTLTVAVRGVLTGEDMRQLLDLFARIKREHGSLFVLYDGRQCTSVDADARKAATQGRFHEREADLRVAFGVPYVIRTILNMILRAQKVLFNRDVKVHLFEHGNEAHAFLEKERARIRREKGLKTSP